jgi:two-component system, cell cycle response regulator CpdR
MRILVVDDEQSFGNLLSRTLKRLGHKPLVAVHPSDALEMLESETVDAVITDIDMPVMNGVALARAIRAQRADMPIAFCTGSARDSDTIEEASAIGRVLPKVWTVADVKDVVTMLAPPRRVARGSAPGLDPFEPDRDVSPEPTARRRAPTNREQPEAFAPRRRLRKVSVPCRSWAQVEQLCRDALAGKNAIAIRGDYQVDEGARVIVALELPDELVLSINAVAGDQRCDPATGDTLTTVRLVGLTHDLCGRLRGMALEAGGAGARIGAPSSPVPGIVLGNVRKR